jgi:hypothetical protein
MYASKVIVANNFKLVLVELAAALLFVYIWKKTKNHESPRDSRSCCVAIFLIIILKFFNFSLYHLTHFVLTSE